MVVRTSQKKYFTTLASSPPVRNVTAFVYKAILMEGSFLEICVIFLAGGESRLTTKRNNPNILVHPFTPAGGLETTVLT
jgi:hypothetical protein